MKTPSDEQIKEQAKAIAQQLAKGNMNGLFAKAQRLTEIAPRNAWVQDVFGAVNGVLGRHKEAIEAHAKAVELMPQNVLMRYGYAQVLQRGGKYEEALLEFERLIYQTKGEFRAQRGKASTLIDMGRGKEALKSIRQMEKLIRGKSLHPRFEFAIQVAKLRIAPEHVDANEVLTAIAPLVEDERVDPLMRRSACFQMGRINEKLDRYDAAFECWNRAKLFSRPLWDPDKHSERIDKLIELWSEDCPVPSASRDGSRLIFILGMMRSGTSLTEQMIAQIDGVVPGGEMNAVSRRVSETETRKDPMFRPLPLSIPKYTQSTMDSIAAKAWEMYNEVSQAGRITDKQPFNCYFVPLIARMFPGCKIIHCVRDAQDCCLSNYIQAYSRPHPQTNELYWLGRYHRDYQRMMDAWRGLSLPSMLDLHYEKLVADPEGESRRVTDFLGVEWNEDILSFHKSSRSVPTASREQVRKPIYKSSVKKHERYTKHLADLRHGLGIEDPTDSSAD